MKITTITLVVATLISCWLFAHEKLQELFFDDFPTLVSKESTVEKTVLQSTTATPGQLFNETFETTSSWTFINSGPNEWFIGTAVSNGGTKSLYVTNDKGVSNEYSNSNAMEEYITAVSPLFSIPANATDYIVSFDWHALGNGNDWWVSDALSVWLIPETYTPAKNSVISPATSGGLLLKGDMYGQKTFKKENIEVNLAAYAGTKMKLAFQWVNDDYEIKSPPAAIDNILVYENTCKVPDGLTVSNIQLDAATINWDAPNASVTNFELYLGIDASYPTGQTGVVSKAGSTTHTFTNLTASTYYYVWYRSVCSATNKSYWVGPVKFMTVCGELQLPLSETFDTDSNTVECWTIVNNNSDDDTEMELSTNYKMEGDRGVSFRSHFGVTQHDSYLISPTLDFKGGLYKLTYYYETTFSGGNEFELRLSTTGKNLTDFTTILLPKKTYNTSSGWVKETVYINNLIGKVNIAWHVNSVGTAVFGLDNVTIENVTCTEPLHVEVSDIKTNSALIKWQDTIANEWEYAIVQVGNSIPATGGIKVLQTNVNATTEADGTLLVSDTVYEVYVRSKCLDGTYGNEWIGPISFKTTCDARNVPYSEGFNSEFNDLGCWTILDAGANGTQWGDIWKQSQYTTYEGDRCMSYTGSAPTNDDWLITPGFNLTGGLYAVTFYYKVDQNTTANLDVKYSTTGVAPTSFTQSLATALPYKGTAYTKKVVYIENVTGVVNIGFHVTGTSGSVNLDAFSIEPATCRAPENLEEKGITSTSVDIEWTDSKNTRWEYYLMVEDFANTLPTGGGSTVSNTKATISRVNGTNAALQPNTAYKVFVRSSCGTSKYSEWVGPLKFRTACEVMPIPYQEGFNTTSSTQYCWKIIDGNNDAPWYGGFAEWFATDQRVYEGDQSMYFTNYDQSNDDWLLSPYFNLNKNKIYRITFMLRTMPESTADFEFRLSKTGREKQDYTTVLIPKASYTNVPWEKQKILLSGIDGNVSFGFYVSDFENWMSDTFIDDFRIEEVIGCPEPLVLNATNITGSSATISWDNDYGNTKWEYFVRKKAFLVAPPITNGIVSTTNTVAVTKDNFGADIEGNTWYEFYVRSVCADNSKTEWTGPHYFRTDCTYDKVPYWEGFNGGDSGYRCWTNVNSNNDRVLWRQIASGAFEGSHAVTISQTGTTKADDWFISPMLKQVDPTKTYRVKFNYKGSGANEMKVVASTNGNAIANFTHVIAPAQSYVSTGYKVAIYYFTGLSSDMYLGLHATGSGAITIDNLFIDEVVSCGQPLNLEAKNATGSSINLVWQDNFGATEWEYMIQDVKQIAPTAKDSGVLTASNDFVATKKIDGKSLVQNTDYVYYVRTKCSNGKYSDWSGPIPFSTTCDVYTVPYEAGFNSNTKQNRCWSFAKGVDGGTAGWKTDDYWAFEGDQYMQFKQTSKTDKADSYLISPTIQLVAGTNYVLKYYYKTDLVNMNQFEVLLSTTGTNIANFTRTLVSKKAYNNSVYVQETVFISGVSGNVNIAWHAVGTGVMTIGIDKVTIEKASACAEPTNVRVTDYTTNTIDVEWDAQPGVTQWEVFVADYGSGMPAGASGTTVTGTPKYTATGLTSGKAYHIYVRAKCSGTTGMSNWSTPANGPTEVSTNGGCNGALTIPVNTGFDCVQKLGVSSANAPEIDPNTFSSCMQYMHTNEMWFEFTATSTTHLVSLNNIVSLDKLSFPSIALELFSGNCTAIFNSMVICYAFEDSSGSALKDDMATTLNGLTPGAKYYMRLTLPDENYLFDICITTSEYNHVTVSKTGDKYTTEELVKDVLIKSDCDLVSNVKYQAGDNKVGNTLGYFNKNGSTFPFEEGIVLATHDIATTPGPYFNYGDAGGFMGVRGKIEEWEGDPDLNAVIASAGGAVYSGNKSVAILEFDFIPVKDTIKFEYLMASESYLHTCTVVCWGAGSLFAAWLTELETGEGQNLAIVPGTKEPITLSTVRDTERSGAYCTNVNPEYFGHYFGNGQDNPLSAPINYIGMTKPMSSEPVYVKPGTKYRIKLAMADFCNTNHVSAVFFNAKSFDLGSLDLGADLTVANNTAICSNESKTIKSGLLTENVEIKWLKDDVEIIGANQPDLEVTEAGQYTVVANYPAIKCEIEGTIKVEMFKPLNEIIHPAVDIQYCRNVLGGVVVNLTDSETSMFKGLNRSNYNVTYYKTREDAENAENSIDTSTAHSITSTVDKQTRYIVVEDLTTGCTEIFTVGLVSAKGEEPKKPADVKVCAVYTFTELPSNQAYYTGPAATGVNYKVGDQIHNPGTYTIYVFQDNGNGCYEETSFTISITEAVVADEFEDKLHTCDVHILAPLSEGNRYFTGPNKTGIELKAGQIVPNPQTIYIYIESEDGVCSDESSYQVNYEECPIPKGVSPNGDGYNDTFDLSSNGVTSIKIFNRYGSSVYEFEGPYTNQWYGQNKQGKPLPSGTYYYVVVARGEVKTGWVQLQLQL